MFRAMDVTKKNFPDLLPEIKQSIDSCDFLAIDTELTGLYNSKSTEHAFDTMEERYSKLKEHCSKILIIQFGISAFKYDSEEKKYTHRDYNFYVFPPSHLRLTPDPKFICQTSSIHFLASYGFNFNKVIYEGIPYLTLQDEEKAKDYVNNKYKNVRNSISTPKETSDPKNVEIPEEHKDFIEKINKQVDDFISNESEVVMHLEPCNAYRRKLIYDSIQQKHKTGIEMSSKVNKDNERFIAILKCTEQDKLNKLQAQEDIDLDDVDRNVGFRKVMDYISASKKLVIGHNMYLDVLHTIEQFFFPLPEDLQDFKDMCRMTFPHIIDTKCLASSEKLRPLLESTQLGSILKSVHENPFGLPKIEPEDGNKGYDLNSEHPHEAGFDALMTGICFIGLSKKLASLENFKDDHVGPSHKVLKPFANRIHVMKRFDTFSLNLAGPDPEPKRDNVFYVSFPEEWKRIDLVELFLPYGEIYVDWLDDVSALVALKQPDNTLSAKKNLVNKTNNLFKVKLYSDYNRWCHSQSNSNQDKNRKSVQTTDKFIGTKRRNSASEDGCNMEQIPEVDENEAETKENSDVPPPSKKLKPIPEESETPPRKIFEEEKL